MKKKEQEESEKKREALIAKQKEDRDMLDKEYTELMKELETLGGNTQSYAKDSIIEIPGPLFSKFTNFLSNNNRVLDSISQSVGMFMTNVDMIIQHSINSNDEVTIDLVKEHIKQVKLGKTVSNSVIEEEDAEVKINEIQK